MSEITERLRNEAELTQHLDDDALIREAADEIERLEKLVEEMNKFVEFVRNAPVSSGVCCCGDNMDDHADPYSCGHSPLDQWEYSVSNWIEQISKAKP